MALADELLDSISEEQFAEYMLVEENPHIVIDEDRNIILPERYKIIAAQGDHDMTTYTFDCPRFSDGRDMSKMVVYINYIRSDGETGSYPADNVSIDAQDNDLMHFEWTPLLPATLEHGAFAFLVCVCRAEPDGSIKNHWSTRLCKDATISEGMDCHKDTIINMYPDVITRILERLNVLEDGGTTSVQYTVQDLEEEQKVQARKNIEAADAKEVSKLSEDIATKASAIKEKASGELIVVTDSAEEKPLGLAIDGKSEQNQYSGKNLFQTTLTAPETNNGVKFTPNPDGSITLNGTATSDIYRNIGEVSLEKDKKYRISGCPSGFGNNIAFYYNADCASGGGWDRGDTSVFTPLNEGSKPCTIQVKTGTVASNLTFYPMVTLASIADDTYEPFVGGKPSPSPEYKQEIRNIGVYDEASGKYAVEVKCTGKNLLKNNAVSKIEGGITFTVNEDGSVILNGTALVDCYLELRIDKDLRLKSGNYILSGCPSGGSGSTFFLETNARGWLRDYGKGIEIPVNEDVTDKRVYIGIIKGTICNNLVFKPMIRLAEITDDTYEPYKETTATVYLDEPLRKGDKVFWNGSKQKNDRNRSVEVFDGSDDEKWTVQDTNTSGKYRVKSGLLVGKAKPIGITIIGKHLCDSYVSVPSNTAGTFGCNSGLSIDDKGSVYVYDENFNTNDISLWKAHLAENPITVEYELAEPTTEEIDIDLGELSMFYPTTILSNDCNANMEVTYIADTKAYIDKKFAELATAMV